MTALAIILAGLAVMLAAGLVAQAVWLHTADDDLLTLRVDYSAALKERDAAVVTVATQTAQITELTRRLAAAEQQRNDAAGKAAADVGTTIADSAALDALAAVNRLSHAVPNVPAADPTAAGGDSGTTSTVQPAPGAGPGTATGRSSAR